MTELLAVWLLTYLLHSTVLLGVAALLRLWLRDRRLGLQEATLRAALLGGFLTASLQLGLGIEPMGGVLTLPESALPVAVSEEEAPWSAPVEAEADPVGSVSADARKDELIYGPLPAVLNEFGAESNSARAAQRWELPVPAEWGPFLGGLWLAGALCALARLAAAAFGLRRLLSKRRPVTEDGLTARVAELASGLGLRRRVPLSTAPSLEVPLATGVFHPEVCLPTRALEELETDQQVAVCAHELAHVARRDPAWILVARVIEAVAPLQPLNTWARRRLQDLAECLSDDLAVAASGRPVGLARSLVDVASWTMADPLPPPAAAAGALSARSRLGHRVERLMDPMRSLERPGRLLLPLAALAVLATALVTPVVSGSPAAEPEAALSQPGAEPPEPPEPPQAPEAPEAPEPPEPPEAPEPPESQEAPEPAAAPDTPAARRLEELTRQIEQRAGSQNAEMAEIQSRIEALVAAHLPDEKELALVTARLETAARAVAEANQATRETQASEETREEMESARAELDEAREALQEVVEAARLPEEDLRELRERAREMARRVRPTPEEREQIRRLSEELAKELQPEMEKLKIEMEHMRQEIERETLPGVNETMREMSREIQRSLRESLPEMRELARMAREVAREASREVERAVERDVDRDVERNVERDVDRDVEHELEHVGPEVEPESRERPRPLEDVERTHLESPDGDPDTDQP